MPVESTPRNTRGAVRLAWGASALVAIATWAVGCGDGEPQPPVATGSIPALTVEVGNTESVDLAGYFSDADGNILTYTATSSDPGVATAAVSGTAVQVTAVAGGSTTVTVTAPDPGGLSADQDFAVTVPVLTDRDVLEILYDSTDGDNWRKNTNWKSTAPLDEWSGISTDASGRVTAIDLNSNDLTGSIPEELGGLANLESLELSSNELTGSVPSARLIHEPPG